MSLSDKEVDFVRTTAKSGGLPSTIKECVLLARLTNKKPEEILKDRLEVNKDVNAEIRSIL